jgi:hypothetical protein
MHGWQKNANQFVTSLQTSISLWQQQKFANENMMSHHLRFFASEAHQLDLPDEQKKANESYASSSRIGTMCYVCIQDNTEDSSTQKKHNRTLIQHCSNSQLL